MRAIFISLLLLLLVVNKAETRPIIADLSERNIDINANFTGKQIHLYGARVEAGDIVIVVRGPDNNYTVRKKEKIGPVWLNTQAVEFKDVPQFYMVASSKKIEDIAVKPFFEHLGIGLDNISMQARNIKDVDEIEQFKQAMLIHLNRDDLYGEGPEKLPVIEKILYKILLKFPEKIAKGRYVAEVYFFRDGHLASAQFIPIEVKKVGFEAFVYGLAHDYPGLYGILAIFLAIGAGWFASTVFRKV